MSGTTIWDTNNKSGNITLSGGSLVATFTSTTLGGIRATRIAPGSVYFENAVTLVGTTYRLGLCNYIFNGSSVSLGADTNGVGINAADGTVKINNVTIGTGAAYTTADNVDIAFNPKLRLFWYRVNNGNWNNVAAKDPGNATLTDTQGGFDTTTLATGGGTPMFPAFTSSGTNSAAVTSKFSTAFTRTAPTGYASVDANPGAIVKPVVITVGPNSGTLCLGPIKTAPVINTNTVLKNALPQGQFALTNNTPSKWTRQWSPAAAQTVASGTVLVLGAAAAKKVRLYDQATGDFLGETTSSAVDGTWSIPALGRASVYAVCLDDSGTYNSLVFDLVVPL